MHSQAETSAHGCKRKRTVLGGTAFSGVPSTLALLEDKKRPTLEILISNASDRPIYAQIVSQIQDAILSGELADGAPLPSIRALANDLHISVITTKRAYAELEELGFIDTVQGKGSFVAGGNREMLREGRLKRVEELLAQALGEAVAADITPAELHDMLDALSEEG